jgi:predicted ATPase
MPPPELSGQLGRFGSELGRLVPELSERVPGLPPTLRSDPETERYRLFDAVAAWLTAASAASAILVVVDDLQWATKPTLLLFRHLVRSSELKRLLILGTYRDTELGHDHPLVEVLADLRRQGGVERLSLMGLDSSGVAAFIEQAAGRALEDEDMLLARAIYEETEGNPFFVREVLRHLVETGALERREGRWATRFSVEELGIPEGVRELVGRRLSRLSAGANRVLRTAAVVGAEFEPALVRAAEEIDEEELISALEEATGARLVMEGTLSTTGSQRCAGPPSTAGWRRPSSGSTEPDRVLASASWPVTGWLPPSPPSWVRPSTTPAGRGRRPWLDSPPKKASAGTPRRWSCWAITHLPTSVCGQSC